LTSADILEGSVTASLTERSSTLRCHHSRTRPACLSQMHDGLSAERRRRAGELGCSSDVGVIYSLCGFELQRQGITPSLHRFTMIAKPTSSIASWPHPHGACSALPTGAEGNVETNAAPATKIAAATRPEPRKMGQYAGGGRFAWASISVRL
jgi:hypothetical protein